MSPQVFRFHRCAFLFVLADFDVFVSFCPHLIERVVRVELAHDEWDRIPEVLDEFSQTVEEIGPNPYKGF